MEDKGNGTLNVLARDSPTPFGRMEAIYCVGRCCLYVGNGSGGGGVTVSDETPGTPELS